MGAEDNIKTIQRVYEAFGRGDVATILDAVADDVDWGSETSSTVAPWYGIRHGRSETTDFFETFGATMEVEEFTPYAFAANDDDVFSIVHLRARTRSSGAGVAMDLHHFFTFRDGLIARYRGSEDTAQVVAALQG